MAGAEHDYTHVCPLVKRSEPCHPSIYSILSTSSSLCQRSCLLGIPYSCFAIGHLHQLSGLQCSTVTCLLLLVPVLFSTGLLSSCPTSWQASLPCCRLSAMRSLPWTCPLQEGHTPTSVPLWASSWLGKKTLNTTCHLQPAIMQKARDCW